MCGDFFYSTTVLNRTIRSAALPYPKHGCRRYAGTHVESLYIYPFPPGKAQSSKPHSYGHIYPFPPDKAPSSKPHSYGIFPKSGAGTTRGTHFPLLLMLRTATPTLHARFFAFRLAATAPEMSRTAKACPGFAPRSILSEARRGRPPRVKPSTKLPPTAAADCGFCFCESGLKWHEQGGGIV